jgi:hypothetical protein
MENFAREEPTEVKLKKTVQENFVSGSNEKIAPR